MSVTVLLPVYNGGATLGKSIESILRQDMSDWELLVIDDGSTDGSAAIAAAYAALDKRIRVIAHERNVGLATTLNEGLEHAAYDLIARLDADDVALPARLRVQREFMRSHRNVVAAGTEVFHMGRTEARDRRVTVPHTPREIAQMLQRQNCIYHPSVIFRRDYVRDAGGYRVEFEHAEDYELWLRLARAHDLANLPEPLIRYRFSVGGVTLSRPWVQLFYVFLAQEVNRGVDVSFDQASAIAQRRRDGINRRQFMLTVASGTAFELARLGFPRHATRLIQAFAGEIGAPAAARLAARVLVAAVQR